MKITMQTKITILFLILALAIVVLLKWVLPISPDQEVRCIDGDTFVLNGETIRMSYINTPERGQEGYQRASDALCDRITHNEVKLVKKGVGYYGRTLAEVFVRGGGASLNYWLIEECLAEPYWKNTTEEIKDIYKLNCESMDTEFDDLIEAESGDILFY